MTGAAVPEDPRPAPGSGRRSRGRRIGDDAVTAAYFKERVYATFTGLAIVIVTSTSAHPEADHAFLALLLGVLGITAAGFASEVISHLAVHRTFPNRSEFAELLRIAGGAMGTVLVPGVLLALAWLEVMDLGAALRASAIVFVVTLALIGWLAVRRSQLSWWKQLIALAMLLALGLLVIVLQTLAHSI